VRLRNALKDSTASQSIVQIDCQLDGATFRTIARSCTDRSELRNLSESFVPQASDIRLKSPSIATLTSPGAGVDHSLSEFYPSPPYRIENSSLETICVYQSKCDFAAQKILPYAIT
jgi:hypothetical protein